MAMLDDDPSDPFGKMSSCACKKGKGTRDLMRRTVAGIPVAFLRAYLDGKSKDFDASVRDPALAPVLKYEPAEQNQASHNKFV